MLTKLRGLSNRAKIALGAAAAILLAAGIGLAVWQPWNQQEEPADEPDIPQQEPVQQPQAKPEKGPSIKVGNEEIPCSVYTGDNGWTILVPDGWESEGLGDNGVVFTSEDGAQLSVLRSEGSGGFIGEFMNLSANAGDEKTLLFFTGTEMESYYVYGDASKSGWTRYERIFAAMARTMYLANGDKYPFAQCFVTPQEPDWQEADGMTVLFLDKDGYVLDQQAQEAVEAHMRSWPEESRQDYTGQYRINSISWAGSYTGINDSYAGAIDGYVDVFRAEVQYRLTAGGEERLRAQDSGVTIVDGWAAPAGGGVYLALIHDGGAVDKVEWRDASSIGGWPDLATELTRWSESAA